MIKFIKSSFILLFFSLMIIVFLSNPNLIMDSVNYSVSVFLTNVLPSLFPFFILADALINYGYVYFLNRIFRFKYSYLIFLSLFSGLPSNAKYISKLLESGDISLKDAEVMMAVTFFPNPMFVVGSVGALMLSNVNLGIFILVSIYISNFIVYLFNYRVLDKGNISIHNNRLKFTSLIKTSIINNAKTLVVILGTIVIFTTLSNVIFYYVDVPSVIEAFITGIFEMTSGVKKMSTLDLSTHFKVILISVLLAFSGISVLCQALSMVNDYKINVKNIINIKLCVVFLTLLINYFYVVFFMWIYFNSY